MRTSEKRQYCCAPLKDDTPDTTRGSERGIYYVADNHLGQPGEQIAGFPPASISGTVDMHPSTSGIGSQSIYFPSSYQSGSETQ